MRSYSNACVKFDVVFLVSADADAAASAPAVAGVGAFLSLSLRGRHDRLKAGRPSHDGK